MDSSYTESYELKLIIQTQHGDKEASQKLLDLYSKFLRSFTAAHALPNTAPEDAYMEFVVCFYNIVKNYDASKGAKFITYLTMQMNYHYIALIKHMAAEKRKDGFNPLIHTSIESTDENHQSQSGLLSDPKSAGILGAIELLAFNVENKLNTTELEVYNCLLQEWSSRDIAKSLGMKQRRVEAIVENIRDKLRHDFGP